MDQNKGMFFPSSGDFLLRGDQVRPGTYALYSTFERVLNFKKGDQWVSLVHSEIGAGPDRIVITQNCFQEIKAQSIKQMRVTQEHLNEIPLFNSKLKVSGLNIQLLTTQRLEQLRLLILKLAPPRSLAVLLEPHRISLLPSRFDQEVSLHLMEGLKNKDFTRFSGVGWGLTPCGDDLLYGFQISRSLLSQIKVSASFCMSLDWADSLDKIKVAKEDRFMVQAKGGCFSEAWKKLIEALFEENPKSLEHQLLNVFSVGASSGADTAVGFYLGMKWGIDAGSR